MESNYENQIPIEMNNVEETYELPMKMNNDEGTYDTLLNANNVEAEVHGDTKQTGYMKIRTVIVIFLILIIVFVGVSIGTYLAGKAAAECRDDVTALPNVAVTPTSTVTPGSMQDVTRQSSNCPYITCPTPECPSSTSPERCSDDWLKREESCYFFGKSSVSFSKAVSFCQGFNAKLIEVNSDSENQFAKNYLSTYRSDSNRDYWMGLTDNITEGTFVLISSSKPAFFFDWRNGEPNNKFIDEDFVIFEKNFNFTWNDVQSSYGFAAPICEL